MRTHPIPCRTGRRAPRNQAGFMRGMSGSGGTRRRREGWGRTRRALAASPSTRASGSHEVPGDLGQLLLVDEIAVKPVAKHLRCRDGGDVRRRIASAFMRSPCDAVFAGSALRARFAAVVSCQFSALLHLGARLRILTRWRWPHVRTCEALGSADVPECADNRQPKPTTRARRRALERVPQRDEVLKTVLVPAAVEWVRDVDAHRSYG